MNYFQLPFPFRHLRFSPQSIMFRLGTLILTIVIMLIIFGHTAYTRVYWIETASTGVSYDKSRCSMALLHYQDQNGKEYQYCHVPKRFIPNKTYPILYDPNNPQNARIGNGQSLQKALVYNGAIIIIITLLMVFAISSELLWYHWRLQRWASRQNSRIIYAHFVLMWNDPLVSSISTSRCFEIFFRTSARFKWSASRSARTLR